jgi:rhamnogalacturonan endolyase
MIQSNMKILFFIGIGIILFSIGSIYAQDSENLLVPRYMENLGRGVVAISQGIVRNSGTVYIGWRMLGTDPNNIAFNVYRSTNGGEPVEFLFCLSPAG